MDAANRPQIDLWLILALGKERSDK